MQRMEKDGQESRKKRKRKQLGKTIKSLEDMKNKQPVVLCIMINSNYKLESSKVVRAYEECCQQRLPWAVCTVSETQTRSPSSATTCLNI